MFLRYPNSCFPILRSSLSPHSLLAFSQQIEYDFEKIHGENADKAYNVMKRIFDVSGEELHKIGFKVEHINGTTSVPFTIDMATDEEKEMVELGFMTLDGNNKTFLYRSRNCRYINV